MTGRYGSPFAYGSDMPEPMEDGHYRYKRCQKCRRYGHSAEHCRRESQHVNLVQKQKPLTDTNYRDIDCWACGKKGHIRRFCRTRQNQSLPVKEHLFSNF